MDRTPEEAQAPGTSGTSENVQVVAHIPDPEEAHVAAGFLNSYGLNAQVLDTHFLNAQPFHRFALGGYRLAVVGGSPEDGLFAKKLLAEINTGWRQAERHKRICEKCGRPMRFSIRGLFTGFSIISGLGLPFISWNKRFTCRACRHIAKPPKSDARFSNPASRRNRHL